MNWKSGTQRYGAMAILMHWTTALAVAGLLVSGLVAASASDAAAKAQVLRAHAPIGIAVLAITLLRIGWWIFADRRPAMAAGMAHWQAAAARTVHRLFYVAILVMAGSGIGMMVLSGAGEILFGGAPGPLPDFWQYAPRIGHAIGFWLLLALVAAHVAAALFHQFALKDRLLARMGIGRAG